MRKVKAIIERASDGCFGIYMADADDMSYLITASGKTLKAAMTDFLDGYEDMKQHYAKTGKQFEEVEFEFVFELPAFLQHYSQFLSLVGLERITGVNQKQLGHYISGYRHASQKTIKKIEDAVHKFGQELLDVKLV